MSREYSVKLSIAITTHNHEKYLSRALDSIFEQTHDYTFEVVIGDDCSTDRTSEIIQAYHKKYPNIIRPVLHPGSIGISKAHLRTLRSCTGEYIATLDGNDYWTDPDKLKKQITFLDNNPEIVLSSHRFKQLFENTQQFANDFTPTGFFKGKPDGFEFGPDLYFKHWLPQMLTIVLRRSALDNTPQLETYRYCCDIQILWTILTKGKGYVHNFFGGVYSIPMKEIWNENDEIKQCAIYYLILEELLVNDSENQFLKKAFDRYREMLITSQSKNKALLDIKKIKNKDFTIISDDGWGDEVYKGFGLQALSPFIGINIFNADFVELVSKFEYYMSQPLQFISIAESKYIQNLKRSFERVYPVALLGEKVELHFINYTSVDNAKEKWNERVKRMNWRNLFFKMDASREDGNLQEILTFNAIHPQVNKVCFLSAFQKRKIANEPEANLVLIDHWNPEPEILFPFSLTSFDVTGWLSGGSGIYSKENPFSRDIFRVPGEKQDYYFIRLNKSNINLINAPYFPESYDIQFDEEMDYAVVNYDKSHFEHFVLETKECLHNRTFDLFIDLTKKENRHVFVLAKNNTKAHTLRVDFVAKDQFDADITLQLDGFEQEISEEFEWMHFDFSTVGSKDIEHLYSNVKAVWFCLNPTEQVSGILEIMAIYIGSEAKFEEIINL